MLNSIHLLGEIHMVTFTRYMPFITLPTHFYITYSLGGGEYCLHMTYMKLKQKLYLKICCTEFIKGRFLKSLLSSLFMIVSFIWSQRHVMNYLDIADFFLYLTDHYFLPLFWLLKLPDASKLYRDSYSFLEIIASFIPSSAIIFMLCIPFNKLIHSRC